MAKEPMYNLDDSTVGLDRAVSRDQFGFERREKVPVGESEIWMDVDGNEMWILMSPTKVKVRDSEKHAANLRRDLVKAGAIPKRECPHTRKYSELIPGDGRLVPLDRGQEDPHCEGARVVMLTENTPEALEVAASRWNSRRPEIIAPCEHYLAIRKIRRERAAEMAALRTDTKPPEAAILALAKSMSEMADRGYELSATRDNLTVGNDAAEERLGKGKRK